MRLAFTALTLILGFNVATAAMATVDSYQERRAETLCKAAPEYCGEGR